MEDKFLKALNAEIEYMEKTKDLSEEEQHKADEEWEQSEEHQTLKAYIRAAILFGKNDKEK